MHASPIFSARANLWVHQSEDPRYICMIGDFNEVRSSGEVAGGAFSQFRANLLIDMMIDCNVMDMDTVGVSLPGEKKILNLVDMFLTMNL